MLAIAFIAATTTVWPPIHDALEIGSSEHYEVTKAYLMSRGLPLYKKIWNDQPPLHTILLSLCFKTFGPDIVAARLLGVLFGASLIAAVAAIVGETATPFGGCVAALCLLVSPNVLPLCISSMLEVPALATGLWAFWAALRANASGNKVYWLVSGVLLGLAMEIKFTAALLFPALVYTIADPSRTGRNTMAFLILFSLGIVTVFGIFSLCFERMPMDVFYQSHFSAATRDHAPQGTPFECLRIVKHEHQAMILPSIVGLLFAARSRKTPAIALAILLATVIAVHACHRPWWPYYYLHLAIPLACLAGVACAGANKMLHITVGSFWRTAASIMVGLLYFAIAADLYFSGTARFDWEVNRIRSLPTLNNNKIVAAMERFRTNESVAYTRFTMFAFHAKIPVIPEIAVLPLKRFWSEDISPGEVCEILAQYMPHQVLIHRQSSECSDLLAECYTLIFEEDGFCLYIRNL